MVDVKGTPSTAAKVLIVIALVVAVGAIMFAKNRERDSQTTASSALAEVEKNESPDLPRLVDLGAGKCIPCKMMAPILEELKEEYGGRMEVVFIDVWENPNMAREYDIEIIPTQIFYDAAGKELFRHQGFYSREEILAKWEELGVDL